MKEVIPILLLCAGAGLVHAGENQEFPEPKRLELVPSTCTEKVRPNVIIILSDDQGYGDFSCHGNPLLETPNLDELYGESIRFDNFHVAPLCTPTRGQLLTGLDAMHNKAATVLTGRNLMRRDIQTMPEVFRENGYATGIFGKWHLGDNYPDRPMDRGFEKSIWHKGWGLLSEEEYNNDYYETRYLDSLKTSYSGAYCTNLWFNKAMEWMDEMHADEQPFFTFISLNTPHGPFYSPAQDHNEYDGRVDSITASFFGMIRNIDRNMGNLDNWLEKRGLKENTLVVYMTDNGGTRGVDFYNAGMRDKKGSNYDGGHRAACFIRWPKASFGNPRTVYGATEIQDLLPTFIDLLDFSMEKEAKFDGISLVPVLKDQEEIENRMFVVQYGGHTRPEKYFSCVVWDAWRLVGENELYELNDDPGQETNIAGSHPEILKAMQDYYEQWWERVEPGINQFIPVIVGDEKEDPVIFNSNNWVGGAVNTQWKVAQAGGDVRGGVTHIRVDSEGRYLVKLSRWPFHLERSLMKAGPETTIGGTRIRTGKAVPIAFGCVSVNQDDPLVVPCNPGDTEIAMELNLRQGDNTVQAWFMDKGHRDLIGAYYISMEKVF
ncbi:MAG: arylsulfatase [Bacteroidales bacterium]